jgi:photosystem II stability/assembly factor-like uncharacterized protein
MLKKIIVAVALLFNSFLLSAQWEVKHINSVNSEHIFALKFMDDINGYAMGSSGLILKTTDQGETWQNVENNIEKNILDFEIISVDTLIAVTTIYDGSFNGSLLKSTDGGISWEEKYVVEGYLRHVQFLNSSKGFFCGSRELFMTTDGGETWEEVFNVLQNGFQSGSVSSFDMIDDSIGYAVGKGKLLGPNNSTISFLLKTVDGGETWEIMNQYDDWFERIDFVNEQHGYITTDIRTYRTTDGGITWDTLSNIAGVSGISIPSENKIITVNHPDFYLGMTPNEYAVSISEDSGDSWDGEFKVGPHLDAVFFLSESIGFVAGDRSVILKTEHGGGEFPENYPGGTIVSNATELIEDSIKIYPNPVGDKLYFKDLANLNSWSYKITSLNAQTLMEGRLNEAELDVSDLAKGVYIITLKSDSYLKSARILKL